jgi:transcriptional regulator of acetoin/glycerol metabolism
MPNAARATNRPSTTAEPSLTCVAAQSSAIGRPPRWAGYAWPENVRQLRRVVREAVARADLVDVHHLAPEVLDGSRRTLTRLERLERDEIVRCLTEPGTTVTRAAEALGIGRATLYRKIAQYGITLPS